MKRLFAAALFAFCSLPSLYSQDKYEFAIIAYFADEKYTTVALDGQKTIREEVDVEKFQKLSGLPLLKKVKEYQELGWEVITFTNATYEAHLNQVFYAYMRKKKTPGK